MYQMKLHKLGNWEYRENLECMLFFAQRLDELLFYYSIDTYRYPVMSLESLCDEYIRTYHDVKQNIIGKSNLTCIFEELTHLLSSDPVAIEILTKSFVEKFEKQGQSWNDKDKFDYIGYIRRKLGNFTYYHGVVNLLKTNIKGNSEKRLINKYVSIFVRLLIDYGYDENYIYYILHKVFFHDKVDSYESLDIFFNVFDFKKKRYDVYIGFSRDISELMPLFQKMQFPKMEIAMVDLNNLPMGIKARRQRTVLEFKKIKSLDIYSAYTIVQEFSSFIVDAYGFYSHISDNIKTYGQVVDENKNITRVNKHDLLKYRVSALSCQNSNKYANDLLKLTFLSLKNLQEILKVTRIHNAAVASDNTSDSLLSLWSLLESLIEDDSDKIGNIKKIVGQFLKSAYVEKLITTIGNDIKRWNLDFYSKNICRDSFGENDLEHTFAFIAFDSRDEKRKLLYSMTDEYPLLRYRVYFLNAQMKNSKGIKSLISEHVQRIMWHIQRIYRARNYIIHDGRRDDRVNQELVINLHSYVDTVFSCILKLMNESPYRDSMNDIVVTHKIDIAIMDEHMEKQAKEKIDETNALKYLYYRITI